MTDAFQFVEPLKEVRRDGLSADSRGVAQLRKYFPSNATTVKVINGIIRSPSISGSLFYLVGAYGIHERFDGLDLTRRRELFSQILDISVRTLIRKEDAAIDQLAQRLARAVNVTENGTNSKELSKYLSYADKPLPDFKEMVVRPAVMIRESPEVIYKPSTELQQAINSSFQKIADQNKEIRDLLAAHEREVAKLQTLMDLIAKFESD